MNLAINIYLLYRVFDKVSMNFHTDVFIGLRNLLSHGKQGAKLSGNSTWI